MNEPKNLDSFEMEILEKFKKGEFQSVATQAALDEFKMVARITTTLNKRVNIRLSSGDLKTIQIKALEEGIPYQTLISSVLHKYVTGRLVDISPPPITP